MWKVCSGSYARSLLKDIKHYSESKRVEVLKCLEDYHISYSSINPVSSSIKSHAFNSYSSELKNMCKYCYCHKSLHSKI